MLSEKYAHALYEATKNKSEDVSTEYFSNFLKNINKNGYKDLLPKILIDLQNIIKREKSDSGIKVVISKKGLKDKEKNEIIRMKKEFNLSGNVKTEINNNIIGGFLIQTKNIRIDKSYKMALNNLYKKIIS